MASGCYRAPYPLTIRCQCPQQFPTAIPQSARKKCPVREQSDVATVERDPRCGEGSTAGIEIEEPRLVEGESCLPALRADQGSSHCGRPILSQPTDGGPLRRGERGPAQSPVPPDPGVAGDRTPAKARFRHLRFRDLNPSLSSMTSRRRFFLTWTGFDQPRVAEWSRKRTKDHGYDEQSTRTQHRQRNVATPGGGHPAGPKAGAVVVRSDARGGGPGGGLARPVDHPLSPGRQPCPALRRRHPGRPSRCLAPPGVQRRREQALRAPSHPRCTGPARVICRRPASRAV